MLLKQRGELTALVYCKMFSAFRVARTDLQGQDPIKMSVGKCFGNVSWCPRFEHRRILIATPRQRPPGEERHGKIEKRSATAASGARDPTATKFPTLPDMEHNSIVDLLK